MRTCLESGLWSGSEPTCTGKLYVCEVSVSAHSSKYIYTCIFHFIVISVIDCGVLGDPTNGEVLLSSTTFNSAATYSCNTGYTLTGDDMRTCLQTGLWSGSEPMCTGKWLTGILNMHAKTHFYVFKRYVCMLHTLLHNSVIWICFCVQTR